VVIYVSERKVPSSRTLRARLQRIRRRAGGSVEVIPSPQLAAIVGPRQRSRGEFVRDLQRVLAAKPRSAGWIEVNDEVADLFYGIRKIRATDIKRIVTLNVSLPGNPVSKPFPPPQEEEEAKEETDLVR
jgi:hypothetical protein